MNTLISITHRHMAKAVCFLSSFAIAALLAVSFGAESAHAEGPVVLNRGGIASLNPQPLPPRYTGVLKYMTKFKLIGGLRLGDEVMLNPQPLPPRWIGSKNLPRPGDKVSLNPQPLPPKARYFIPLLKTR